LARACAQTIAAATLAAGTAQAQEPGELEEVFVTATRRSENMQLVPISVSALEGERMDALFEGGEDIRALATRVPSLYAESSNGRISPRFYIRGLGNSDFDLAASQPVSIVVDEVVLENVVLKSSPLFDLERVEVLRGPQGTLFGRNTPAGIVKFDTKKPSQDFDADLALSYGELDSTNVQGAIGGGLSDTIAARVAVLYQSRGDWINNDFTGESDAMGGFDEFAWRAQLLLEPSESFSALLNVHGRDVDGTSSIFRANVLGPGSNGFNSNYDRDTVSYDEGGNNPQSAEGLGASLRMDFNFDGDTKLTSITAYEETERAAASATLTVATAPISRLSTRTSGLARRATHREWTPAYRSPRRRRTASTTWTSSPRNCASPRWQPMISSVKQACKVQRNDGAVLRAADHGRAREHCLGRVRAREL
jgi:iron complex outermembrane receptor protein